MRGENFDKLFKVEARAPYLLPHEEAACRTGDSFLGLDTSFCYVTGVRRLRGGLDAWDNGGDSLMPGREKEKER